MMMQAAGPLNRNLVGAGGGAPSSGPVCLLVCGTYRRCLPGYSRGSGTPDSERHVALMQRHGPTFCESLGWCHQ